MSSEGPKTYREGLSVIIPAYNAEKTLRPCIESVIAQELDTALEVLLIDDGSTDRTGEICDEYAGMGFEKDIRIHAFHIENRGVSNARNTGMDKAVMEFITFVDADDTLTTDCLPSLLTAIIRNNALMSCESDRIIASHPISGYDYVEHGVLNGDTHVWGKVYRHSFCDEKHIRFPEDLRIGEDMIFLLGLSLNIGSNGRVICIPRGGYRYTENPEGAMLKSYDDTYLDQIHCWQRAGFMMQPFSEDLPASVYQELSVIRVMSAMLVVGKIAELGPSRWRDPDIKRAIAKCSSEIYTCLKTHGTYLMLSAGYKAKIFLYRINIRQYLFFYRWQKNRRKRRNK